MKKRGVLLLAATIGLMLIACGDPGNAAGTTPGSTGSTGGAGSTGSTAADVTQEESQEAEKLPASQEYVSADGAYKVILLEGLTQTDMQIQAGSTMMALEGDSNRTGFSAISLGSSKSTVPGNPDNIEGLEDYADYITGMILDGSGVTVSWEETDAPSAEGAEQCLAREGVARSGVSRGQAYGYYVESADSYFSVVIVGNDDDVEEARQIIALEILDAASRQGGTRDYINAMTAVLDSVNGANVRETFKMLEDAGADENQLELLASQARQSLSASWEVENASDLMETADWLMNEGHNQNALEFLGEFGGTNETDRDAFIAELKEQNLDDGTYISLLAAYDAWSAYGDGAIAAWDLSRVGTIMGFGYASGYCTYEEAMDKMLEAAQKSQELFDSWEDFNKSYLYGYSYWAEESLDDSGSSAAERAELVNSMESQANGPFSIEWNMELEKEW
ncbi:MAG: DUF1266 domain-containing protein [Acetatifactor sp.]|nr:DUF1266 domain-containing protein [Acetatifactor sp.]